MTNPFNNDPQNSGASDAGANNTYGAFPASNDPEQNQYGNFPGGEAANMNEMGLHGQSVNVPGVGRRFLSFLVDSIVALVIGAIFMGTIAKDSLSTYFNDVQDFAAAGSTAPEPTLDYGPVAIASLLSFAIFYFLYRGIMESQLGGTLGRMATGTKVIDTQTQGNISYGKALLRCAWYPVSILINAVPLIGTILSLVVYIILAVQISRSPQGQHICDQWAKAQVVYK